MKRANRVLNAIKTKRRRNLKARVRDTQVYLIDLSDLSDFQDNGLLSIQVFKENISKLFPLVLSLVSEGHSIPSVERLMGFNRRALVSFLQNHSGINRRVNEARKIHLDRVALAEILSWFLYFARYWSLSCTLSDISSLYLWRARSVSTTSFVYPCPSWGPPPSKSTRPTSCLGYPKIFPIFKSITL